MKYAIYARVSTALDEQKTSYETQIRDMKKRIKSLYPDYRCMHVYGDLGISGTKEERPEFQQMLEEADRYDLIITKSISRFARNTRLLLNSIKVLEEKGCHVLFLEENIDTSSHSSKFLLTVLGGIAEMESNNLSEHIKEGYAIRRAAGKAACPNLICYGYKLEDHKPVICEEEAEVIRKIFKWYTEDNVSIGTISRRLRTEGVTSKRGSWKWARSSILYILKQQKLTGDCIEKGQIFEGTYPAIISHETFEQAQQLLKARRKVCSNSKFKANLYPLSGICFCKECKGKFTRMVTHQDQQAVGWFVDSRKGTPLWTCMSRPLQHDKCENFNISEEYLYRMIIEAICVKVKEIDNFDDFEQAIKTDVVTSQDYEERKKQWHAQMDHYISQQKKLLDLYLDGYLTKEEMMKRNNKIKKEIDKIERPKTDYVLQKNSEDLDAFIEAVKKKEDTKALLYSLFKDQQIKRSIVGAMVEKIIVGGAKYTCKIYIKSFKQPVICYVEKRSPGRYKKARYGDYGIYKEVKVLEKEMKKK